MENLLPFMLLKVAVAAIPNLSKALGAGSLAASNTPAIAALPGVRQIRLSTGDFSRKMLQKTMSSQGLPQASAQNPAMPGRIREVMGMAKRNRPEYGG